MQYAKFISSRSMIFKKLLESLNDETRDSNQWQISYWNEFPMLVAFENGKSIGYIKYKVRNKTLNFDFDIHKKAPYYVYVNLYQNLLVELKSCEFNSICINATTAAGKRVALLIGKYFGIDDITY